MAIEFLAHHAIKLLQLFLLQSNKRSHHSHSHALHCLRWCGQTHTWVCFCAIFIACANIYSLFAPSCTFIVHLLSMISMNALAIFFWFHFQFQFHFFIPRVRVSNYALTFEIINACVHTHTLLRVHIEHTHRSVVDDKMEYNKFERLILFHFSNRSFSVASAFFSSFVRFIGFFFGALVQLILAHLIHITHVCIFAIDMIKQINPENWLNSIRTVHVTQWQRYVHLIQVCRKYISYKEWNEIKWNELLCISVSKSNFSRKFSGYWRSSPPQKEIK